MSPIIEWTEDEEPPAMSDGDLTAVDETPCTCPEGQQLELRIEEGDVVLSTPECGPGCRWDLDDHHALEMAPIPVVVRMATDCPAYDTDDMGVPAGPAKPTRGYEAGSHYIAHGTRCDCNWWPVVIPVVTAAEQPGPAS